MMEQNINTDKTSIPPHLAPLLHLYNTTKREVTPIPAYGMSPYEPPPNVKMSQLLTPG